VRGAFHFEEDADLVAGGGLQAGGEGVGVVGRGERGELHALLEAVARHVGGDVGDHLLDRLPDLGLGVGVERVGQAQHRVAHHQRRVGRVQDDDGLAALGAADLLDCRLGGLSELVDVGAGAWAGGLGRDRGDDLGVPDGRDPVDGGDDGNRGLPAAGHHVHVGGLEVGVEVDRGHRVRADRRRGQVDELLAVGGECLGVLDVGLGRRRVEDDPDVVETVHGDQAGDARGGGLHAEAAGAPQTVGVRVEADHRGDLERRGQPLNLDEQVGADVPGPDDGDFGDGAHGASWGTAVKVT